MSGYRGQPPPFGTPNYPTYQPTHPQPRSRPDQAQPPVQFQPTAPYQSYSQQYSPQQTPQQQYAVPAGAYGPGQTQGYVPYVQQHANFSRQPPFNPDVRGMEYHAFSNQQPSQPIKYQTQETTPPMMPQSSAPMYWHREEHNPQIPIPQQPPFNEAASRAAASSTFERFDQDNSGYLDLQEFMDALRSLHVAINYHDALECFARYDANEDGRIGKQEFVTVYVEMKRREV